MAGFRTPEVPREQLVLWSQGLDDAIPVDHPVRHVVFLLQSAAFSETFAEMANQYVLLEGKPPYHPRALAGLYLYGMLNGIRSSRRLEQACYNRIDVIWLMSGQHPDHATIAAFVKKQGLRLRRLLRDTALVAMKAGLVRLHHTAVDGTKIEADAGRGSVMKEEALVAALGLVEKEIGVLEAEWAANEAREKELWGEQVPWVPSGEGTVAERVQKLERQQERLEKALEAIGRRRAETVGSATPQALASVTDPDSRVMKDKEGRSKPNYNAQLAVDAAAGVIVAAEVNDQAEDSGLLRPLLEQVEENCGRLPTVASADSQYNTGPELAWLEERQVTGYLPDNGQRSEVQSETMATQAALAAVAAGEELTEAQWEALPKDKDGRLLKEAFRYDAEANVYRCPMRGELRPIRHSEDKKKWGTAIRVQYGGCSACASCPRAQMCCSDPSKGRTVNRDQYEGCRERLRSRMKSASARQEYDLRRETVEPRFGYIKRTLGIRRFQLRGLEAVTTEWLCICTAVNLGILLRNWEAVRQVLGV